MGYTPYPYIEQRIFWRKAGGDVFFPQMAKDLHHHSEEETKALKARLRRIVGQLNGIERMLEADRDCADVLMQLVSARKALKSLSERVVNIHMHQCIEEADSLEEGRRRLRELLTVLERYVE